MLEKEDVRKALPPALKHLATQEFTDMLNALPVDPEVAEHIQQNFLTYAKVLTTGRFKMEDYLNAVAFVTFTLMGYTNQEAYARTFPQRIAGLTARGLSAKEISSYVSAYANGKLPTSIKEQAAIPVWLVNQHNLQDAINVLAHQMNHAKSEMVRVQAANSILTHLKRPETKEVNINLGVTEDSGVDALKAMMTELAERQIALIESGATTQEIAHQKLPIINHEDLA